MNKKQTIRTLGSIENKQTKETKQPKQPKQTKKSNKVIENESDDNIEVDSEPEEEYIEPVLKPKKEEIFLRNKKRY